jgi:hypothetical protein
MNLFNAARFILMSLVVFVLFNSCHDKNSEQISIVWEDHKAVQLIIPGKYYGEGEPHFQVFVTPGKGPAILGDVINLDGKTIFEPFIPLTRGFSYRVMLNGKLAGTIQIPAASPAEKTEVLAVHPSYFSVPENLLKIYIEFSKPMKEGESLQHIVMIHNRDTLPNVFLDLQPELWNNDRTILTLWLDPGRIKRDLQPNLALGPPLTKNKMYTFFIKQDWEAADGSKMQKPFIQKYFTVGRDSISPDPSQWKIRLPQAGFTETLEIRFGEPLDYMVARNAIHILDKNGKEVPGKMFMDYPREDVLEFIPEQRWQKGNYTIWVESKLEDIAGNNLDHPFDNDITQQQKGNFGKGYKRIIEIN